MKLFVSFQAIDAYALVGDILGLAEKIQGFFMQEVLSETHSLLKDIVLEVNFKKLLALVAKLLETFQCDVVYASINNPRSRTSFFFHRQMRVIRIVMSLLLNAHLFLRYRMVCIEFGL